MAIQRVIVRLVLVRTLARAAADGVRETPAVSVRIVAPAAEVAPERIEAVAREEEIVSAVGKLQEVRGREVRARLVAQAAQAVPQHVPVVPVVRRASEAEVPAVAVVAAAVAGGAGECKERRNEGKTNEMDTTESQHWAYGVSDLVCSIFPSSSTFARCTTIETND